MDGSNEKLIQLFSEKLEGMSDLRKTFHQFYFYSPSY